MFILSKDAGLTKGYLTRASNKQHSVKVRKAMHYFHVTKLCS